MRNSRDASSTRSKGVITMAMAGVGPARSDSSTRDDVQFELKWDPTMTSNTYPLELHKWASAEGELRDIEVTAKDGVLTLSGYVSSYWEKDAAEKAVKRVCGMRAVANDVQIRLTYSRTDPKIARDAVHKLESHTGIPSENTKATVKDGCVTLEGTVDWQYQAALAESCVKELKGVLGVSSNINVKPQGSPTQVKGNIENALRRSAELDARRITVDIDGVVRRAGASRF
jgi:osmotically-inducible protein OsmY